MRRTRLVFAPHEAQAPPAYLLLNEFGEPVGRGEQPVHAEPTGAPTRVVLVVPGVDVTARWVDLPARSEAQARAAAALLLEDAQALDEGAAPHLALGPLEADGHRLIVTTSPARMQAWLDLAKLYGLAPDAVVPDCLLLPQPEGETPLAARFGPTLAVRGQRQAFAGEPELAALVLGERTPQPVEGEALERLLGRGAAEPAIDLRQGAFAPADGSRVTAKDFRLAAVLAGLLVLSPALLNAAQALRLTLAADGLQAQARREAAAVLPKGTALNDPMVQVAAQADRAELAAGGGPAGLAAQLFRALSEIDQAQVESLIVSPDGAMRAQISHVNYSDGDLLAQTLKRNGIAFREEGVREEGGRIVSDVILGVRP